MPIEHLRSSRNASQNSLKPEHSFGWHLSIAGILIMAPRSCKARTLKQSSTGHRLTYYWGPGIALPRGPAVIVPGFWVITRNIVLAPITEERCLNSFPEGRSPHGHLGFKVLCMGGGLQAITLGTLRVRESCTQHSALILPNQSMGLLPTAVHRKVLLSSSPKQSCKQHLEGMLISYSR